MKQQLHSALTSKYGPGADIIRVKSKYTNSGDSINAIVISITIYHVNEVNEVIHSFSRFIDDNTKFYWFKINL